MRVLVTGATGFIGRHLVKKLSQDSIELYLMIRRPADPRTVINRLGLASSEPEIVFADIRHIDQVNLALKTSAPNVVYHLAASGVTDPYLDPVIALEHNVIGTLNLIQGCFGSHRLIKPNRVIIARTPGEFDPNSPYAASKAAAWQFCKMYSKAKGWPIVGAMIFQAYGPQQSPVTLIQSAIRAALEGEDLKVTSGVQKKDWIYIDDVTEGLLSAKVARIPAGTSFDLGTGTSSSVAQVVKLIFELVDRGGRPHFGSIPNRIGESLDQIANVSATKTLLGWTANVTLKEGLTRLISDLIAAEGSNSEQGTTS